MADNEAIDELRKEIRRQSIVLLISHFHELSGIEINAAVDLAFETMKEIETKEKAVKR
jgi:hypothetical protein